MWCLQQIKFLNFSQFSHFLNYFFIIMIIIYYCLLLLFGHFNTRKRGTHGLFPRARNHSSVTHEEVACSSDFRRRVSTQTV